MVLILLFLYGLMNQVSARFIPESVYEASYRHSFVASETSSPLKLLFSITQVKESHEMEVVKDVEVFTDKNHAARTFLENSCSFFHLKTSLYAVRKGIENRSFQARIIRLILFPFHHFF